MKICKKCNESKDLDSYHNNPRYADSKMPWCKICCSTYGKMWRTNNVQKNQDYYNANIEHLKIYKRQWRETHTDQIYRKNKIWRKANPDKERASIDRWQKANPDKLNATCAKRRATKLHATPPWLTSTQIKQIERYYMVAKWIESILHEPIQVDHIVPLQGNNVSGLHVPWNLQLLTAQKNKIKGNRYSSVSSHTVDRSLQDSSRVALYLLLVRLLNMAQEFDFHIPENYN